VNRLAPVGAKGLLSTSFYGRTYVGGDDVLGEVTHHNPPGYAAWVNDGTGPHYVPPKALIPWATAVLGSPVAAYAVANKIAKSGTEGSHYLERASELEDARLQLFFDAALARLEAS